MLGTIVEESLKDNRYLNELNILSVQITENEDPKERWHLYSVNIDEHETGRLAKQLKVEKWYAHFWDDEHIIVVFPEKTIQD